MKELIHQYGAWIVFALVFLESVGLPLPGEAILVSAAIFAGTTHDLSIALVLVSAMLGAILGSTIGFWIGDRYSEARFEEKLAVTRASGTRHSSIRFVAGELNPMPTREAPFLSAARQAEDSIISHMSIERVALARS